MAEKFERPEVVPVHNYWELTRKEKAAHTRKFNKWWDSLSSGERMNEMRQVQRKSNPKALIQRRQLKPKCEICEVEPAGYFQTTCEGGPDRDRPNLWKFVCSHCRGGGPDYHVEIQNFFRSKAEQKDWQLHLSSKNWINMIEFRVMIERWIKAGGRKPY